MDVMKKYQEWCENPILMKKTRKELKNIAGDEKGTFGSVL